MLNRILLLMFVHCLFAMTITAQNYAQSNLLIDYEGVKYSKVLNEQLNAETVSMLQTLLENVGEGEKIAQIEIVSYAPNRDLAADRLLPIVDFFETKKIKPKQIDAVTEISDEHKIAIKLMTQLKGKLKEETLVETKPTPRPKVYCAGASKTAQVFLIAPKEDVRIKGEEGTELRIKRADLVNGKGEQVQGAIKVELKEFYKPQDILLADLHTMEGGKAIETGGMLNLKITAKGSPLQLRSGKSAKIRMPAKNAKTKKGMNLFFGKTLENGAVDWRRETREKALSPSTEATVVAESFEPSSYIQLKKNVIIDSISYVKKLHVKAKHVISNHYPNFSKERIVHSHEEEYFDLELPYFNPNIVDGVWVNADKRMQNPFGAKPTEILVRLKGVPVKGLNLEGNLVSHTPKIALMLKERAVFLRGEIVSSYSSIEQQNLKFEEVPVNQEAVLVAFLDTGKELLFATQDIKTLKATPEQVLEMKPISKADFDGSMANLAN